MNRLEDDVNDELPRFLQLFFSCSVFLSSAFFGCFVVLF